MCVFCSLNYFSSNDLKRSLFVVAYKYFDCVPFQTTEKHFIHKYKKGYSSIHAHTHTQRERGTAKNSTSST